MSCTCRKGISFADSIRVCGIREGTPGLKFGSLCFYDYLPVLHLETRCCRVIVVNVGVPPYGLTEDSGLATTEKGRQPDKKNNESQKKTRRIYEKER